MNDDDELPYVRAIISFQPLTNSDIDIKSLLDSGATHSFIQLNVLPIYVQQEITKYIRNPTRCKNKLSTISNEYNPLQKKSIHYFKTK